MNKFGLTHSIHGGREICLKPSDPEIEELILTWRRFESFPNEQEISEFVQEMTPKLFEDFQNMEIDNAIKSRFYL